MKVSQSSYCPQKGKARLTLQSCHLQNIQRNAYKHPRGSKPVTPELKKSPSSFHFFLSTQGFWGLTTYFRSRQWHDSFQTPCHHSAKTQLGLVWVPFDTTLTIKYPIELKAVFLLSSPTWRKGRKIISNSKLRFICNVFQVAHTCICFLNNLLCTVQYCFFSCLSRTEKYSTPTEIHCS